MNQELKAEGNQPEGRQRPRGRRWCRLQGAPRRGRGQAVGRPAGPGGGAAGALPAQAGSPAQAPPGPHPRPRLGGRRGAAPAQHVSAVRGDRAGAWGPADPATTGGVKARPGPARLHSLQRHRGASKQGGRPRLRGGPARAPWLRPNPCHRPTASKLAGPPLGTDQGPPPRPLLDPGRRPLPRGAQQTRPHPRGPSRTVARDPVETQARPLLSASPPTHPIFSPGSTTFPVPASPSGLVPPPPPPPPRAGLRGRSAPTSVSADSPSRGGPPSAATRAHLGPPPAPPTSCSTYRAPLPALPYIHSTWRGLGCLVHWKYPST